MNLKQKVVWGSGLTAFISGMIAFFPSQGVSDSTHLCWLCSAFIDAFYNSFVFMTGDGGHNLVTAPISEQIAAVAAPIFVGSAIISLFYQNFKNFLSLIWADNHTIICGLGNMGFTLAKDILTNHKEIKLVMIENNPDNPYIAEIENIGGVVVIGDAMNGYFLKKVKAHKANEVILLTGRDIINIEIASELAQVIKEHDSQTKIHIHLDDRDNYDLLSSDIFKDRKRDKEIDIKSFSIYDLAAQTLFMKNPLDSNVDTLKDGVVKVAIVGYDKVAEALLYRALSLGHFYNQKPIEITIFDKNIEDKKRVIRKSYPMLEDKQNSIYWNVKYKEETELYLGESIEYTQIIFCDKDIENSFTNAIRFKRVKSSNIYQNNTKIYLFGDIYQDLTKVLKDDNDGITVFGLLEKICSYNVIVNETLDAMAKQANKRYNELHGYDSNWDKLSAFLKDSNRMQVEHLPIKLQIVNHFLSKKERYNEYDTIKEQAKEVWFKYETNIIWDKLEDAKILAEFIPFDVLDRLARVEHNRWNAFHILNGWKKKDISVDTQVKITKDKKLKLHPCLVSWDELDNISKNHQHDYKSDDIETVMRISDMTKHLDDYMLQKCYMKEYLVDFRKLLKSLSIFSQR